MARPKGTDDAIRPGRAKRGPLTEDTPLTPIEQQFIHNYIKNGGYVIQALKDTGIQLEKDSQYKERARSMMNRPNVLAEITRIMDEARKETVAVASEVMEYFTAVMRGEIKDQFGLEASLSERTKAAQELAKRTVDIENRKNGEPDQVVSIKLDWSRD